MSRRRESSSQGMKKKSRDDANHNLTLWLWLTDCLQFDKSIRFEWLSSLSLLKIDGGGGWISKAIIETSDIDIRLFLDNRSLGREKDTPVSAVCLSVWCVCFALRTQPLSKVVTDSRYRIGDNVLISSLLVSYECSALACLIYTQDHYNLRLTK